MITGRVNLRVDVDGFTAPQSAPLRTCERIMEWLPSAVDTEHGSVIREAARALRSAPAQRSLGDIVEVETLRQRQDEPSTGRRLPLEVTQITVSPDPRSQTEGTCLKVHLFAPHSPIPAHAPIVLYAHGGSIRPEPILSTSFLPALVAEAERRQLGCRFVALAHRGSGDHEAKRLFSLEDRVDDLITVRRLVSALLGVPDQAPLLVVGNSMGGHVALMALRALRASSVALLCPAIYSAEAHAQPLGPGFTTAIRKHSSWRDSPAFLELRDHLLRDGHALLLGKSDDEVIPAEVTQTLATILRDHGGERSRAAFVPGRHATSTPETTAHLLDFIASFAARMGKPCGADQR